MAENRDPGNQNPENGGTDKVNFTFGDSNNQGTGDGNNGNGNPGNGNSGGPWNGNRGNGNPWNRNQGHRNSGGFNPWHKTNGHGSPFGGGGNGPKGKKYGFAAVLVVVALLVVCVASAGVYRVDEQEAGVLTMFGKYVRTDTAGLYFKIPFIQQVRKVDTTIHGTGIGYSVSNDGQTFAMDTDSIMITSDFNLIDIDFYLEYRVTDPYAYLFNSTEPEQILKNIALAAIRSTVIDYTVDDAMTVGKAQIQAEVRQKMQEALTENDIGIQVVNVTVQDAEPPTEEIVKAFKAVETAKQGKDTAINNANKYKNEKIPAAEANADKIIQEAEAEKTARIAEAEGQTQRFTAMYEKYKLNPLITKQRLYYETIEELLPGLKVIISDGNTETMLPLASFGAENGKGE